MPIRCIVVLCLLLFSVNLRAQTLPSNIDFSTVNVDNLSDQQLQQLWQKAQQNGLSVDDVVQQAQARGMAQDQAAKLRSRLTAVSQNGGQSQPSNVSDNSSPYGRKYGYAPLRPEDSLQILENRRHEGLRNRIFGADLFSNANLTFEPNLNIPTPGNYIIGPGDELVLDVYGVSEKNSHLTVTPEGYLNIPNVGPVLVSGLTMDEAKVRVSHKLESIYAGVAAGNTHVQLLLGAIRSIRVLVIGEIMRPGSYTLPSLATVANALYVSGGPDVNGSFRDIQVIRDGKPIVTFDLYDFLAHGSLASNVLLRDQDIVKVNPYQTRIELSGEVKHPAIFEAKPGETLGDILGYAGGYTSNAYKGFVRAVRVNNQEREIVTVPGADIQSYPLHSGDIYYVDSILNRYSNRVVIMGSVFHPGEFALEQGMTVKDLIGKADGLKEDAFTSRALVKRLRPDYSPEILNFNVNDVLNGSVSIPLQREDSIFIYSKFKIREPYYVIVAGEVNHPDTIPFADSMRLGDVILLAGGLKDAASLNQVEVGRRIRSQQYSPSDTNLAIVQRFSLQRDLGDNPEAASFALEPFDRVMVRHAPGYHEQIVVRVEGEVTYPGSYVIDSRNERLSDLIRKAGGLKPEAFAEGSLLLRQHDMDGAEGIFEQNKIDVFRDANKGDDSAEVRKVLRSKSGGSDVQLVGINLDRALQSPRSKFDLLLQEQDIIKIPKQLETVSLYGEIFYPKQVRFDKRFRFKDFISQGGGFTTRALRRGSYVVYPNGEVASTRKVFLFNHFPKVKPGSEIFVPAKKEHRGLDATAIVGIVTAVATVAALIITVTK
ncbi:MAG TPA: SLBB domain-containing protein [Dinghuibacter sp.]|uniref:SLBB domain-containing protein n=1 Tax=Dinghuibacter sp. TaxID=2024697 RepID=UPI002CCFE2D6|nr:SLBB domain-containing protein [Dinghuibacter sp.]HTJ10949.1 SLBB domain-containing protein [Dinghuibacter sp.]